MNELVLSIFPGLDLLGRAFEEQAATSIAHAWAAGLFDGEGCVSLAKGRQSGYDALYYRVDLTVSNTDVRLLNPLVKLFGGNIYPSQRSGNQKPCWNWKATGSAHSAAVLERLMPFLIAKREQASVALEACALLKRTGWRRPPEQLEHLEALKEQMHQLNKRGLAA